MVKKTAPTKKTTGGKKGSITPLGDRVLIKAETHDGKEKRSASGIIIPMNGGEEKVDRGTVIACGDGRIDSNGNLVKMSVKNGDNVLFQWADKVKIDGEEYYVVSESSILAIIK